jgi:hypothetical protein
VKIVNVLLTVLGFLQALRFSPTKKVDRIGLDKHTWGNEITIVDLLKG